MAQRHCEIRTMLQRVYNVMKVCNIVATSAPVFRTRGDRGFLGKRNLGRIITREISPNVRFQTRIIRTCIVTSAFRLCLFSLSLSLSLFLIIVSSATIRGEGLYRINFSDDGLHIYRMYICIARRVNWGLV